MLIAFIGPPGAGKGTQAALLVQRLKIPHVSTGDLLRQAKQAGTELGKTAARYMDQGNLVPDEVIVGIVGQRLAEPDCERGCLLDGFPRTLNQAKTLDEMLQQQGKSLDLVLHLECDEEEIIRRLSQRAEIEGRADDTPETIAHRQRTYRERTQPVLEYYSARGLLRSVDGMRSRDEVFDDIWELIAREQANGRSSEQS